MFERKLQNMLAFIIGVFGVAIIFTACQKNKPDTLTPFGDTVEYPSNPSNPGNPAMFNGGGIDNTIQGHVKSHDDQRYAAMPEPRDDGDEDVEGSIQNLAVSTTTQAEIEEVNPAQIKQLTGCTVPRVSFGNAVLTDGAHWKVFAKCVLMTVPKGPIMYGFVPELKRYGSAAGLAWSMNQVGLLKHKVWRKTASEKLNYLERLVMATRLRMLTAQEKDAAVSAIQQYGIVRASYIYLANWYASTYYQKHYDYSKKKSPWYISYLIEGKYVNAANQPIENLNYSVPIELLAGYFLEGKTAVDGKFKNQVFHPVVFPFRAMPYIVNATLGDLRQTFVRDLDFLITSGVKLVFTGLPENPTSSDIWPRPEIARNPLTESLGFASLGDGAGCSKPEVISATGVVHPANWQQYIDCRLGAQSATFSSLLNRNDAVAYLQIRFSEYLNTAAAIYKSDQQNLELLLSIITFREPTSAEKANITSALNSGSIDSVMSDMLLSWYYSFAYEKFDFRKQSSLSKRNIRFSGAVSDENGAPLNGVTVNLLDKSVLIASGNVVNGLFDFVASVDETPILDPTYELHLLTVTHASKVEPITIAPDTTQIQKAFVLPALGTVTPAAGGEARNGEGSVTIFFPAGATETNANFVISDLQTEVISATTVLKFSANPSYTFRLPVAIRAHIPGSIANALSAGATLLAATPDSEGNWELLHSLSWPRINGISQNYRATTKHFSTIYFLPSNLLTCRSVSTERILCRTNLQIPGISPLAEILERRTWIETPLEIPALRAYAKNLLNQHGWNGGLLDDLSNFDLQPFRSVQIPPECLEEPCPHIVLPTDSVEYTYPGLSLANKSLTGRGWVDAQIEYCAGNPTISFPQSRLNAVQATQFSGAADFSYWTNPQVRCERRDCTRVCAIFCGTICVNYSGVCTFEFSASGNMQAEKNMPLAKSSVDDWRAVSNNLVSINYYYIASGNLIGARDAGAANSYVDQAKAMLNDKLAAAGYEVGARIGQEFQSGLNAAGVHDPLFNEDNCFVSNPPPVTSLTPTGVFNVNGFAYDSYVAANLAYIAAGSDCNVYPGPGGLRIVDVATPPPGSEVGYFIQDFLGGTLPGYACTSSIAVDPALPRLYVSDVLNGLQIVDVSNAAHPTLIGNLLGSSLANGAFQAKIRGDYVYVAGFDRLGIINVSNPAAPQLVSGYSTGQDIVQKLEIDNRMIYLVKTSGVQIIDVANTAAPGNPVPRGSYTAGGNNPVGTPQGIAVNGSYAYVSQDGTGISVLDVGNPENPRALYTDTSATQPRGLFFDTQNKRLYVADLKYGVRVFDTTNPIVITPLASAPLNQAPAPGSLDGAQSVFAAGNNVYVSAGLGGLQRFRLGPVGG